MRTKSIRYTVSKTDDDYRAEVSVEAEFDIDDEGPDEDDSFVHHDLAVQQLKDLCTVLEDLYCVRYPGSQD